MAPRLPLLRRPGPATPGRSAASFVRGGARPPPLAHRRRRTGRGYAPHALGAHRRAADPLGQLRRRCRCRSGRRAQARVDRFVVGYSRHAPAAIRSRMRCFSKATADLLSRPVSRLSPGPRLGSEEVHKAVNLVVVLAESTNDNGRDPAQVLQLCSHRRWLHVGRTPRRRASWPPRPAPPLPCARASIYVSPWAAKRVP
jgi:hypothetical protein